MNNTLLTLLTFVITLVVTAAWYTERKWRVAGNIMIKSAESDFKEVMDSITSGLVLTDSYGVISYANSAGYEILGLSPACLNKSISICTKNNLNGLEGAVSEIIQKGGSVSRQEFEGKNNLAGRLIGASISALDNGGAVIVCSDITEVYKIEQARQEAKQMASIGELAASIAHEIRNPLGSIRGSAELLADTIEVKGDEKKLFDLITRESARVNVIISDFLKFARVRKPVLKPCDIRPIINEIILQLQVHSKQNNGTVLIDKYIDYELSDLLVDESQLRQLLLNLGINALEAIDFNGEITLAVSSNDDDSCIIEVSDSGKGVSLDDKSQLFTPFHTTKKSGTGLGLPLVKRIAETHNGSVDVFNSADGGACFRVKLPTAKKLEPQLS
jgi:PAS domain S-box-containing protein